MNSRETLIFHALQSKRLFTGASNDKLVDMFLAQDSDAVDAITKNVCARIPIALSKEMEEIGSVIGLNKRELITMGIVDVLAKVRATLDEFDAWPTDQQQEGTWSISAVNPVEGEV